MDATQTLAELRFEQSAVTRGIILYTLASIGALLLLIAGSPRAAAVTLLAATVGLPLLIGWMRDRYQESSRRES